MFGYDPHAAQILLGGPLYHDPRLPSHHPRFGLRLFGFRLRLGPDHIRYRRFGRWRRLDRAFDGLGPWLGRRGFSDLSFGRRFRLRLRGYLRGLRRGPCGLPRRCASSRSSGQRRLEPADHLAASCHPRNPRDLTVDTRPDEDTAVAVDILTSLIRSGRKFRRYLNVRKTLGGSVARTAERGDASDRQSSNKSHLALNTIGTRLPDYGV